MKLTKIIALSISIMMLITSSAFANSTTSDTLKPSLEESAKTEKKLTKKDVEALVQKYDLEIVSDKEVKELKLVPNMDRTAPKFTTVGEAEKYIIKQKEKLKKQMVFENDIHIKDDTNIGNICIVFGFINGIHGVHRHGNSYWN